MCTHLHHTYTSCTHTAPHPTKPLLLCKRSRNAFGFVKTGFFKKGCPEKKVDTVYAGAFCKTCLSEFGRELERLQTWQREGWEWGMVPEGDERAEQKNIEKIGRDEHIEEVD